MNTLIETPNLVTDWQEIAPNQWTIWVGEILLECRLENLWGGLSWISRMIIPEVTGRPTRIPLGFVFYEDLSAAKLACEAGVIRLWDHI